MRAIVALVVLALLAGCSSSSETELLPWFRVRTTKHYGPPGLGSTTTEQTYHVRRFGLFWKQLGDLGVGSAVALDPRTVVYFASGAPRLVREGEGTSVAACTGEHAGGPTRRVMPFVLAVPPAGGTFDCYDVADGPAAAVATRIRMRRLDISQRTLFEQVVAVEGEDRVFARAMVSFYDGAGTAYFVTVHRDAKLPVACTLIAADANGTRVVARRDDLALGQCSDAPRWNAAAGRPLQSAR